MNCTWTGQEGPSAAPEIARAAGNEGGGVGARHATARASPELGKAYAIDPLHLLLSVLRNISELSFNF